MIKESELTLQEALAWFVSPGHLQGPVFLPICGLLAYSFFSDVVLKILILCAISESWRAADLFQYRSWLPFSPPHVSLLCRTVEPLLELQPCNKVQDDTVFLLSDDYSPPIFYLLPGLDSIA